MRTSGPGSAAPWTWRHRSSTARMTSPGSSWTFPTSTAETTSPARRPNASSAKASEPRRLGGQSGDHNSRRHGDLRNRRVLLDELVALMRDPRQGPAVLAGPGGTGKTTLAAALAERVQAGGAPVWWISAADPVTLSRDLTATARQLGGVSDVNAIARGEADAADRFWRLLRNASPGWLLVFDEADDPRVLAAAGSAAGVQDLTGWVRSSSRGLALVTSRETDRRMWGAARLLRIGELREADAVQMLLELAPTAGDENQARALARRLGGHPLSLRLAGTYLHSHAAQGATFAAYERTLGEQAQADTYERGGGRHGVALTARALKLALDGLAQQGIPQTRPVLQLASCYAPTTIPASLLNAHALTGPACSATSVAPHRQPLAGPRRPCVSWNMAASSSPPRAASLCIPPLSKPVGLAWAARIRRQRGFGTPRSSSSTPAHLSCRSSIRCPGHSTCCSGRTY